MEIEDEEARNSLVEESKRTGKSVRIVHAQRAATKGVTPPPTRTSIQPTRLGNDSQNAARTNNAETPKGPQRSNDPAITKEMWKIWRAQKIRESILTTLGRMQKVLDTDKSDDLDTLRYMVDEDLSRVIKQLDRQAKPSK